MRIKHAAPLVLLAATACGQPVDSEFSGDGTTARPAASGSAASSNREVVEAIERLRAEMAAIRRLLERGSPGGAALAEESPIAPTGEADWAELERAAEARLVVESVSRYRARLLPDLLAAEADLAAGPRPIQVHRIENGVPVVHEDTLDTESLTEAVDWHRKVLAGLSHIRSVEDLARWRNEFQIEPLE